MQFYSYMWLREDGTPYYVGKGQDSRAFRSHAHRVHCPKDKSHILVFPMLSEAEAFESEIALIELFGRKDLGTGCLRNLTDGGDGPAGHVHSAMQKQKIVDSLRGNQRAKGHHWTLSEETKQKMSDSWVDRIPRSGFHLTPEHKAKIGAKSKGRPVSEAAKEKIRQAALGRKPSAEGRQHMSESQKGRKHSAETKAKIGDANLKRWAAYPPEIAEKMIQRLRSTSGNKGHHHSSETKAKMSASGHDAALRRELSKFLKTVAWG